MTDWRTEFYEAKYHLDISKRMLEIYNEYAEKRVLVGVIREAAKAAGKIIRTFLIKEGICGNLKTFTEKIAPKYLDSIATENLIKILEIERDQRTSKVEFVRGNKILLEVGGKWKILETSRLKEIVKTIDNIICNFPTDIKR